MEINTKDAFSNVHKHPIEKEEKVLPVDDDDKKKLGEESDDLIQGCLNQVYAQLEKLSSGNKKLENVYRCVKEGTCIWASIHLVREEDPSANKMVGFAIGSKSISSSNLIKFDCQLRDMHAEALCRRILNLFLLKEVSKCVQKEERNKPGVGKSGDHEQLEADEDSIYVERAENSFKFKLKPEWRVALLCSKMPCGDLSILTDGFQSEEEDSKVKIETGEKIDENGGLSSLSTSITYSNCLRLEEFNRLKLAKDLPQKYLPDQDQMEYQFRLKPARRDLPLKERFPALSCTDKILKWTTFGFEGRYLGMVFKPLKLSHLIIPVDSEKLIEKLEEKAKKTLNLKYRISKNAKLKSKYLENEYYMSKYLLKESKNVQNLEIHTYQTNPRPSEIQDSTHSPNTPIGSNVCMHMISTHSSYQYEYLNDKLGTKEGSSLKSISSPSIYSSLSDYSMLSQVNQISSYIASHTHQDTSLIEQLVTKGGITIDNETTKWAYINRGYYIRQHLWNALLSTL